MAPPFNISLDVPDNIQPGYYDPPTPSVPTTLPPVTVPGSTTPRINIEQSVPPPVYTPPRSMPSIYTAPTPSYSTPSWTSPGGGSSFTPIGATSAWGTPPAPSFFSTQAAQPADPISRAFSYYGSQQQEYDYISQALGIEPTLLPETQIQQELAVAQPSSNYRAYLEEVRGQPRVMGGLGTPLIDGADWTGEGSGVRRTLSNALPWLRTAASFGLRNRPEMQQQAERLLKTAETATSNELPAAYRAGLAIRGGLQAARAAVELPLDSLRGGADFAGQEIGRISAGVRGEEIATTPALGVFTTPQEDRASRNETSGTNATEQNLLNIFQENPEAARDAGIIAQEKYEIARRNPLIPEDAVPQLVTIEAYERATGKKYNSLDPKSVRALTTWEEKTPTGQFYARFTEALAPLGAERLTAREAEFRDGLTAGKLTQITEDENAGVMFEQTDEGIEIGEMSLAAYRDPVGTVRAVSNAITKWAKNEGMSESAGRGLLGALVSTAENAAIEKKVIDEVAAKFRTAYAGPQTVVWDSETGEFVQVPVASAYGQDVLDAPNRTEVVATVKTSVADALKQDPTLTDADLVDMFPDLRDAYFTAVGAERTSDRRTPAATQGLERRTEGSFNALLRTARRELRSTSVNSARDRANLTSVSSYEGGAVAYARRAAGVGENLPPAAERELQAVAVRLQEIDADYADLIDAATDPQEIAKLRVLRKEAYQQELAGFRAYATNYKEKTGLMGTLGLSETDINGNTTYDWPMLVTLAAFGLSVYNTTIGEDQRRKRALKDQLKIFRAQKDTELDLLRERYAMERDTQLALIQARGDQAVRLKGSDEGESGGSPPVIEIPGSGGGSGQSFARRIPVGQVGGR